MKKLLLGLLIGFIVALPAVVVATDYAVRTPHAKYIYDAGNSIRVDVFDDAGNKCYVAYYHRSVNHDDGEPTISCVGSQ